MRRLGLVVLRGTAEVGGSAVGKRGARTKRRSALLAVGLSSVAAGAAAPAAEAGDPREMGAWSSPFWEGGTMPFDPPSAEKARLFPAAGTTIALPDGRLLYWNAFEGSENGDLWIGDFDGTVIIENARVRVLDLRTSTPRWTTSRLERGTTADAQRGTAVHDLFCSDQKLLYDGSVLVAGGSRWDVPEDTRFPEPRGVTHTSVFDPAADSFTRVGDMQEPRWYPSLVTLADGRVAVSSGVRRLMFSFLEPGPAFSQVRRTEIYDPATRRWEDGGSSDSSFPLYPRLHLLPDGKVLYAGAGQAWNPAGQTADQLAWSERRVYDPRAGRWSTVGEAQYGMRSGATSMMLRLEPPYRHADVVVAGGTLGASPSTWAATTLSETVRWTADGVRAVGERKSPLAGLAGDRSQLRHRRWFGTPVMLPTGEVLLLSGGDSDDVLEPGSAAGVRAPELYDPRTRTWRTLASAARDRIYHNTAVLLPDGRVLVGGNAPQPAHFMRHGNEASRSQNFRDATFEIYSPPYLFRGARPVVRKVEARRAGRALRLTMGRGTAARDVSEVVLQRLGATTHAMDADMRALRLRHRVRRGRIVARLPRGGDGRLVPPGPYYAFALRDAGKGAVPSVGRVVRILPAGRDRVIARTR